MNRRVKRFADSLSGCVRARVCVCTHTSTRRIIFFGFRGFVHTSRIAKAKISHPVTATSQAQGRDLSRNTLKRRSCDVLLRYPMTLSSTKLLDTFWRYALCECDCCRLNMLFAFNIYPCISMNALLHRVAYDTN